MDVTVDVAGLKAAEARLIEIAGLGAPTGVRRVLRRTAKPLEARARAAAQAVAVSGSLAASIRIGTRRPRGNTIAVLSVGSRARERTALFVHNAYYNRQRKGIFYGWMLDQGGRTNRKPRPWWTPAVQASESEIPSLFLREIKAAIARIEKRTGLIPKPDTVVPQ